MIIPYWGTTIFNHVNDKRMKLLEGKVAIVTGAARGIGKAIAMKFAEEGASVAFTDLKADENFQNTEKELQALGVQAKGYTSNAADFEDTAKVVAEIVKDFGRIDVLVNNAGITRDGLMMRMSEQQWDMAKSIAKELGSRGIRANAIAPGFIITDMTAQLSQEVRDEWAQKIPLRRGGTPQGVANVGLFLASDLLSYGIG